MYRKAGQHTIVRPPSRGFFDPANPKNEVLFSWCVNTSHIESVDQHGGPEVRDTSTTEHKGINHWLILDLIERKSDYIRSEFTRSADTSRAANWKIG